MWVFSVCVKDRLDNSTPVIKKCVVEFRCKNMDLGAYPGRRPKCNTLKPTLSGKWDFF